MKYEKIKYPDGQISAKFDIGNTMFSSNPDDYIIKMRLNSYEDLFYLKSIIDAAGHHSNLQLFIPCMFGQRSDRRFAENQSFDLKIICDFINSCNFEGIQVFDPHSDVTMALLNNSTKISSFECVSDTVVDILKYTHISNIVLVSPDAGAYKKVFEYGDKLSLPVIAGVKHRDANGVIDLQFIGDVKDKECLIVDDICDGGYTFILLAKKLKELGAKKVYLYISHAYFSKGLDELRKDIDHIFCTNSVKDLPDAWFNGEGTVPVSDFVTQYKII